MLAAASGIPAHAPRLSAVWGGRRAALEAEADAAAERVVGAPFASVETEAATPAAPAPAGVQRKCAACDDEDEMAARNGIQRLAVASDAAPAARAESPATDTTAAAGAAGPLGIIVDNQTQPGPGQVTQAAFMGNLRGRVMSICDDELAVVGRSAEGCPYLARWLGYYDQQSAARIESAIVKYAGTRPADPASLLDTVVSRARAAIRRWASTGAVTGVPPGVSDLENPASSAPPASAPMAAATPAPATAPGVQAKAAPGGAPAPAPAPSRSAAALGAELGGGRPLDSGVRQRMERGFGRSFAGVRVHTDRPAARLAGDLTARAFTLGQSIAFAAGEYRPGTLAGDLLIAHELAHTVQQRGGGGADRPLALDGDHELEDEADLAAAGALGLGGARAPRERGGLRLQGCTKKAKACPEGFRWYPASTVQWGSLGCTCLWKCMRAPEPISSGPAYQCAEGSFCDDPFDRVARDYTATGYGASFTPLGQAPSCGCFPLDIEGNQQSGAPLVPVSIDATTIIGPAADVAQGLKARKAGGGGPGPQTDPTTGTRVPGKTPRPPRPENPTRTLAIQSGLFTAELAPRLEKVFGEEDPAIMRAIEETAKLPAGRDREARLDKVLSFAEGRPDIPEKIKEGATFGKGGTGSVAEVVGRPDLASKTGAGRAAGEAAAMVELELAGIQTVYLAERPVEGSGATRLVLRRIDGVGSKDIIGRTREPPADPKLAKEYEQYVTPRTIADLEAIRDKLDKAHLNIGDFQFIIRRSDGAVFVNDPVSVTPNSGPSDKLGAIIDRFRAISRRRSAGSTE